MFDEMTPLVFEAYKLVMFPLTLLWIILVLLVVVLFSRQTPARLRTARVAACSALVLLYGLSAGPASSYLIAILEQEFPPFQMSSGQSFDAIVVLTGGILPKTGARPTAELGDATTQRTLCGVDAYSKGLAHTLLLSGGPTGTPETDAVEMGTLATRFGIPQDALVLEKVSRNTYESAKEIRRLLGDRANILLVTSAFHIPRSMRLFQKQGLHVTPFPCGYLTSQRIGAWPKFTLNSFVPSLGSMRRSEVAINELVGLVVYKLAGKL